MCRPSGLVGSSPALSVDYGQVVELVDTRVLETRAARREGSSPSLATNVSGENINAQTDSLCSKELKGVNPFWRSLHFIMQHFALLV